MTSHSKSVVRPAPPEHQQPTMLRLGVVPIAFALTFTGIASAAVEPVDAGQPGIASPAQPGTVSPPPAAPPSDQDTEDSPVVRNDPAWRTVPTPAPAAPVVIGHLHLPRPVPRVAPITPPPGTIRIGEFVTAAPSWLPRTVRDQINVAAANGESQIAQFWDSIGFPASRSDRAAAATIVGVAASGTAGFVGAGAPAVAVGAVVGALVGGTIGGIAGAAVGTIVPVPVIGTVTSGVAGTAIGAGAGALIGAAVAGVPAAAGGAVVAGAAGGAVGAAVGVGRR